MIQKNLNDIMLELMPLITDKVRQEISNPDFKVWYMVGSIIEICENLQQMTNERDEQYKFPFIALITDYRQRAGYSVDVFSENQPNFLIATNSIKTLKAAERIEQNFKPVLYPIYQALIETLGESAYFIGYPDDSTRHTRIDRLFLGREGIYGNEANTFNDYVDAIEVRDMVLEQKLIYNCENINSWLN